MRYEVGESSNFILVPMLLEALNVLNKWTPESIQAYCQKLVGEVLEPLQELGCWLEDAANRSSHLFGIRLPDHLDPETLKEAFEREQVFVSVRGDAVRISPHVYNEIGSRHGKVTGLHSKASVNDPNQDIFLPIQAKIFPFVRSFLASGHRFVYFYPCYPTSNFYLKFVRRNLF